MRRTVARRKFGLLDVMILVAALAAALPAVCTLLLSEPSGQARDRCDDVYLLAVSREPPVSPTPGLVPRTLVTVAVAQGDIDKLHPLLHAREVTVAWLPPP